MKLLWITLLVQAVSPVLSAGYYTIVAPKVLRPNSEYHVAVSTQGVSQPTSVVVTVGGKQDVGGIFYVTESVTVQPYTTHIIKLEIGDLGPGSYNLTAKGSGGLNFENTTSVTYIHKSYSVFIQTDKAIYKPGHLVQFRAVVLNSHLKPSVTGALDIYISDGKGNRVKQWRRALTTKGVFSGELQLSQNPVLGDWKIVVTVLDQTFHEVFQVAEYVLPKFEVTIDVPPHATFKNSKLVATIHAKYTYGKPVKGEATVTAYPNYYSQIIQPLFQPPVRKVVPIDGKTTVEFDIAKELQLSDEYERPVQFEVAVEEALTGRRQNNSAQVILHRYQYKLTLITTSDHFKPGLKYTAFVKIAYHDGAPVQDETNPVKITYNYKYGTEDGIEESHKLSKDGLIELNFFPDDNATVLEISAQYLEMKEYFSSIYAATSPSKNFIQAVVKTESPRVNEDVVIEINSTSPIKYFNFQVLGRGDIVMAGTVLVKENTKPQFRFVTTYVMAPTAHVLIYYVADDGEVVADSLDIELKDSLQNYVNISTSVTETEPGGSVSIMVEAKPNSYIGLLGIDQSVLLLKSGNDITHEDVLHELRSYDSGKESPYVLEERNRFKRFLFWRPGSSEAQQVFDNSGTVILTNAFVYATEDDGGTNNLETSRIPGPLPGLSTAKPDLGPPVTIKPVTRPPLEGPFAFSRIPPPVWNKPRVFLMHDLASTWLFSNFSVRSDGRASLIKKQVPDTITSWVITGFSVDQVFGLGLSAAAHKLRVFRPFFVSLDLPYSIIRGEIVAIPVVVFNYMDKDVQADIILDSQGIENFEFAEVSNDVSATPNPDKYRKKTVFIRSNSGTAVSFMIMPKRTGYIPIKVTARTSSAGDGVERMLLVKPEGETQYHNKAFFVDLRSNSSFKTNLTLDIPESAVPGSVAVEVSAVGDILGPSISNLDKLIKMPYGCGEQNMLNFVPNIVVIEYLKNTNQLTPAIESKALKYMETGYQQELTYQREDGSFSAFGNSDENGSTWLTAYVAKSFQQAKSHISIEDRVISEALQWLANNQAPNGSFPEVGKVSHSSMQGGAGNGLALTAYTLIAFLENKLAFQQYSSTIRKALDYLVRNLPDLDDVYALTITSYALNLADHSVKDTAFHMMESKAKSGDDKKWWSVPVSENDTNPWISFPNSVNIEMTAYALLTYLARGHVQDALPVMKWLVSQRNEEGGFASTQDTVVGIYALAKLGEKITSRSTNLAVTFSYTEGASSNININPQNTMILQKKELPSTVRHVDVSASGSGFSIVQVSYRFNMNVTGPWPLFTLDPQVDKNSDANHLQLSICSGFVGTSDANESNMAVMEVTLPSGFTVDTDALPSLQVSQNVKRVETKNGDTVVMLYFDKMIKQEYCPTVSAFRTHKVAKQKPVPVTIYDYYDQTRRARVFYEPRIATLCDICEDEDCSNVCSSKPNSQSGGKVTDRESTSAGSQACFSFFMVTVTLTVLRL